MAKKVYTESVGVDGQPLDLTNTDWSGEANTDNKPLAGQLIETYIKGHQPVENVESGQTRPPTSDAVYTALGALDTVVENVEISDDPESEDLYLLTLTKHNGETVTSRFSKVTNEDAVSLVVELATDTYGTPLPEYIGSGDSLVVYYRVSAMRTGDDVSTMEGIDAAPSVRVRIIRGVETLNTTSSDYVSIPYNSWQSIDMGQFMTSATDYKISVDARANLTTTDSEGVETTQTLTRSAQRTVNLVEMELASTFDIGIGAGQGGYSSSPYLPFTVRGSRGSKSLVWRLNGGDPTEETLGTGATQQSKSVSVDINAMTPGLNVVEAYAIHESGVMSDVFYICLFKADSTAQSYVGAMFSHSASGFQQSANVFSPTLEAQQFEEWGVVFTGWAGGSSAAVEVYADDSLVKESALSSGGTDSYGNTYNTTEGHTVRLVCGASELVVKISVVGHADIEAAMTSDGLAFDFDAHGRTNAETNPGVWESGDKRMEFSDVLWSVSGGAGSGWLTNNAGEPQGALQLSGGASMKIVNGDGSDYEPLNASSYAAGEDIATAGLTIEIEYETANVADNDAELITCYRAVQRADGTMGRIGIVVTPERAMFYTGNYTSDTYGEGEDEETVVYEDNVGTRFMPGRNMRIAFVFNPTADEAHEQYGLIGFYVNGVQSAASSWADKGLSLDIASALTFKGEGADLIVKSVRMYHAALTDDQILNNYIVSRGQLDDTTDAQGSITAEGVRTLDERNRVLDDNGYVGVNELMGFMQERGNSILVMIGRGTPGQTVPNANETRNVMDALAQYNNKKQDALVEEVRFYNGTDRSLDFIARNVIARIQGTSSTNYARKNVRFYFQKTADNVADEDCTMCYGEIDATGQQSAEAWAAHTVKKKNKFRLRQNSIGAKLACAKCDFSDSSMTTNTGGAKFINDKLKEMGLYTPAQELARLINSDLDVRSAIDGTPCDLFCGVDANSLTYYGQYNLNNEKSDSQPIFGQDDDLDGEAWASGTNASQVLWKLNDDGTVEKGGGEFLPITLETLNNGELCCRFQWVPGDTADTTEVNGVAVSDHKLFMDSHFDAGFEFNYPKDVYWNGGGGDAEEEPNISEHLDDATNEHVKRYKAIDRMMSFIHDCVAETVAGKNIKPSKTWDANNERYIFTFDGVDYTDGADGKFDRSKWLSEKFRNEAANYFDLDFLCAYYMYVDFNLAVDQLAKNMLVRTWDGVMWYITYYDGDCQLGSDNQSFLNNLYDDNRQTVRNGFNVMQGHDSWLWNLILANFGTASTVTDADGNAVSVDARMAKLITSFASAFTVESALTAFDTEQRQRWCERLYNKSGIFKYIYPYLNEMPTMSGGTTYGQIYGMKGNLEEHQRHFIERRYALKNVEYGKMPDGFAQFYQSGASSGKVDLQLTFATNIPFRVQIAKQNGLPLADSGLVDADAETTLTIKNSTGNTTDPYRVYGVERVWKFVFPFDALSQGFNVSAFTELTHLDMSVGSASGYRSESYLVGLSGAKLLEYIDMTNNWVARTGSGSGNTLDLQSQSRLRTLRLGGTGLTALTLPVGAPLETLVLPSTLVYLSLRGLRKLTVDGVTFDGTLGWAGVERLRLDDCPLIDGLALVRSITGTDGHKLAAFSMKLDMDGDGSELRQFASYRGLNADGSANANIGCFTGEYRLTRYMGNEAGEGQTESDADIIARYEAGGLRVVQPEFTTIEFYDTTDDANITNLDNDTGFRFGNDYMPSGHVKRILAARHRVMAKMTKEPQGVFTTVIAKVSSDDNGEAQNWLSNGEFTYYPLHDDNSFFYADNDDIDFCTPVGSKTGTQRDPFHNTEGELMMYEPGYWSKGIDDWLGRRQLAVFSSNGEDAMPSVNAVDAVVELVGASGRYMSASGAASGVAATSLFVLQSNYSVRRVAVAGFKQVRWSGVSAGTSSRCAAFVDADGNIVEASSNVAALTVDASGGYVDGDKLFHAVPDGAQWLYFSWLDTAGEPTAAVSVSDNPADVEPEWVWNPPMLIGVVQAQSDGTKLHSWAPRNDTDTAFNGGGAHSINWNNFHSYAHARGGQLVDWEMHSRVAYLFFAKYGRRNAQAQCGGGGTNGSNNGKTLGLTIEKGMEDTLGYEAIVAMGAEAFGAGVTAPATSNGAYRGAWYKGQSEPGNNTCCMGYEDWYSGRWEMMDRVATDASGNLLVYRDGSSEAEVFTMPSSGYITAVWHGLRMTLAPKATGGGSTTAFCDYWTKGANHVLYRCGGAYYANVTAASGVACADASVDRAYAYSDIGARLAFRGVIRKAESVEAYIAATNL